MTTKELLNNFENLIHNCKGHSEFELVINTNNDLIELLENKFVIKETDSILMMKEFVIDEMTSFISQIEGLLEELQNSKENENLLKELYG